MSNEKDDLLLFFQRPLEPIFTERDNGKVAFEVPSEYLPDRYKPIGADLQTRFGGDVEKWVRLDSITNLPDLSFTEVIAKNDPFSLFNSRNKQIAGTLTKIFMDISTVKELKSTAAYVQGRVNPYLFQYALSVAMQHRPDTKNLSLPSIVQVFPDQFIDPSVFPKAREEQALVSEGNRMVVDIPLNYTASDREEEQRLAYFREDIGVNMHHWHWHLVFPSEGDDSIVKKDRRGELFYYMHGQIIARYNVERFCNRLGRVKPLNNLRETIPEGYFPKIVRSVNNRAYPPRFPNSKLYDVNREEAVIEIADLERWADRIHQAIDQGFVVSTSGQTIQLQEPTGIDILANVVENSKMSPNPQFYGNLHNEGHNLISYCHDPENRYLEKINVMGEFSTTMRDPIFYRWHSYIDQIFIRYKNTVPKYTTQELEFNGVIINSINVQITHGQKPAANTLLTYWQQSDLDLGSGLDFGKLGNVYAKFTHLQHAPFEYSIKVTNNGAQRRGTCRIFMLPQLDERGTPLLFREQRLFAIEMDKFNVTLKPGENTIRQRSDQSSVTIPYDRSLRNLKFRPTEKEGQAKFDFCGCGWPQHMLIPKGSPEGTKYDILVMISNYNDDKVGGEEVDQSTNCNDAASFCGLRDALFPDKRTMGFPLDRPNKDKPTLADFANQTTNMKLGQCAIRFTNTIVGRA